MKTTLTSLALGIALVFSACTPTGFHRQKYTDFGHVRGMRFKAAPATETTQATPVTAVTELQPDDRTKDQPEQLPEERLSEQPVLPATDSPEAITTCAEKGTLPAAAEAIVVIARYHPPDTASPSGEKAWRKHPVYSRKQLITGYILLGLGVIGWILIVNGASIFILSSVLVLLGVLFLVLAHRKNGKDFGRARSRRTSKPDEPEKELPEGDAVFLALAKRINMFSRLAYLLLILCCVSLVIAVAAEPMAIVSAACLLISFPLLIVAFFLGRRYKKLARENGYRTNERTLRQHLLNKVLLYIVVGMFLLSIFVVILAGA